MNICTTNSLPLLLIIRLYRNCIETNLCKNQTSYFLIKTDMIGEKGPSWDHTKYFQNCLKFQLMTDHFVIANLIFADFFTKFLGGVPNWVTTFIATLDLGEIWQTARFSFSIKLSRCLQSTAVPK